MEPQFREGFGGKEGINGLLQRWREGRAKGQGAWPSSLRTRASSPRVCGPSPASPGERTEAPCSLPSPCPPQKNPLRPPTTQSPPQGRRHRAAAARRPRRLPPAPGARAGQALVPVGAGALRRRSLLPVPHPPGQVLRGGERGARGRAGVACTSALASWVASRSCSWVHAFGASLRGCLGAPMHL